jgi:hypothetical protein
MRLIFLIWLVAVIYSVSQFPMALHGDIGGWLARSAGFGLPILGVYYGVQWAKRKFGSPEGTV